MIQWEYKVLHYDLQSLPDYYDQSKSSLSIIDKETINESLNNAGLKGWELVSVAIFNRIGYSTGINHYLKRKKDEN